MNKFQKMVTASKIAAGSTATALFLPVAAKVAFAVENNGFGTLTPPTQGYATSLGSLISSVLTFVMVIAALLVLFYLILGGIEWITSGGDKGKTESARNKITSAVIGIIVLAAAYAILQVVLGFLGFSDLNDTFENIQGINETN